MGWIMSLHLKCSVRKEYRELIEKDLFQLDGDMSCEDCIEEEELPKHIRDIITIWKKLQIGSSHIYARINDDNVCEISIKKEVREHYRGMKLEDDYMVFLYDIIVPITTEIWDCDFTDDMISDKPIIYTDTELRGRQFKLQDIVKSIEHVRSDDGTEIYETKVVYKRGLDAKLYEEDLVKAYGATESWLEQ
jgi:hypothetical protein